MATRCAIGMQFGDIVKAVYCHFDGYPDYVGKILLKHYNRPKTAHLIALGDMSSLGSLTEPDPAFPHSFDNRQKDVCVFYGRDQGEEEHTEYTVFDSVKDFTRNFDRGVEYLYLISREGNWMVTRNGVDLMGWKLLEDVLNTEEA